VQAPGWGGQRRGCGQTTKKMPPKGGSQGGGDRNLQSKSPAQFFADNKNIAGFDNVNAPPLPPSFPLPHWD